MPEVTPSDLFAACAPCRADLRDRSMDPIKPIRGGETLTPGRRPTVLTTPVFLTWLALLWVMFAFTQVPFTFSRFEDVLPRSVLNMRAAVLSYLTAPSAVHP
jgi:hypothetical protein